ncbi:MAG: glutamate mutase L [Spirochaetaceae bacterium]|jgi:uncharacterized protein (TIGR01319 family)|nr:glutamate mutase L [Spirochaetaceae bacterium]
MMEALALIDFGSTNTKVTAVDPEGGLLLGTAAAFTTVETDIGEGLAEALNRLTRRAGPLRFIRRLACSSAAGGLRMITSGLVPALTAEAARLASLGAGAKVVKVYSYQLTGEDVAEIASLKPDIFLLAGGMDGGNRESIIHNAGMLAACPASFPVLIAGNRTAAAECERLLAGREVITCPNVMPRLDQLNIEPVQDQIRRLFLKHIIHAKGLSREEELISGILMPTPSAVKRAVELLSEGTGRRRGLGELAAVDLGGATTDVYSVARGLPKGDTVILKGLPEPVSKRTVEGDIGMRYGAGGVLAAAGAEKLAALSGLPAAEVAPRVAFLEANPAAVPGTPEEAALDYALASAAVDIAVTRHAGTVEQVYTPSGPAFVQSGKDLTGVSRLILTGGAVIHTPRAEEIAAHALYSRGNPASLRPAAAKVYIDRSYILAAMGLLAGEYPEMALSIIKKELAVYGN